MRADCDIGEIMDHVKKKLRETLGNKGRRVAYDRLVEKRENGGYGVLDLEELDGRLKKTWLNYIHANCDERFISLVSGWNKNCKESAGTIVGPLLSYNCMSGESEVWTNISGCLLDIKFYFNYIYENSDERFISLSGWNESCKESAGTILSIVILH